MNKDGNISKYMFSMYTKISKKKRRERERNRIGKMEGVGEERWPTRAPSLFHINQQTEMATLNRVDVIIIIIIIIMAIIIIITI